MSVRFGALPSISAGSSDGYGRLASAETRYGWPTSQGHSLVVETWKPDRFGRESTEDRFRYLGSPPGLGGRVLTRSYALAGGGEDFLWRRMAVYPSGFECEPTPDGAGKLQMPKLEDPGGSLALLAQYPMPGGDLKD